MDEQRRNHEEEVGVEECYSGVSVPAVEGDQEWSCAEG